MFAVDTSDAVDKELYNKIQDLLKEMTTQFQVSPDLSHIAFSSFGSKTNSTSLGDGTSEDDVIKHIMKLPAMGGKVDYVNMLKSVNKNVLRNSGREVPIQLILFAVGDANPVDESAIKKEIQKIQSEHILKGISVFVVSLLDKNNTLERALDPEDEIYYPEGITDIPTCVTVVEENAKQLLGKYFWDVKFLKNGLHISEFF